MIDKSMKWISKWTDEAMNIQYMFNINSYILVMIYYICKGI